MSTRIMKMINEKTDLCLNLKMKHKKEKKRKDIKNENMKCAK